MIGRLYRRLIPDSPIVHRHAYRWSVEPDRSWWRVAVTCDCGEALWAATVRDTEDLNWRLRMAWSAGQLTDLGYFTAPTRVPA